MFSQPDAIYTIHENANRPDAADRLELVREGFAFWAFALGAIWLVANRLWVPAIAYILLAALVARAAEMLGVSPASIIVIQVGMQCWLGFHAYDVKRWVLARRGYTMRGVVCAKSLLMAQQRAFAAAQ